MANYYINLYKGNPTANTADGTAVSTDGAFTAPVSAVLDVASGSSETVKLAVRCESGYTTTGNTVISASGTNAGKWLFSATENGTYTASLTISEPITATNVIFYAKVSSTNGEELHIDRSVSIHVQATVTAVET